MPYLPYITIVKGIEILDVSIVIKKLIKCLTYMIHTWNKIVMTIILIAMLFPANHVMAEEGNNFYVLNSQNGMSSNCVLQMLQLNDGRMVVITDLTPHNGMHCLPIMGRHIFLPTPRTDYG